MTNTGGTPAGWYQAPGDPEGTQRYWDGAQWIGEPQPVQPQPPAAAPAPDPGQYQPPPQQAGPPPGSYQASGGQPPQGGSGDPGGSAPPPNYGSPGVGPGAQPGFQQGAPAYGAPAQGYQSFAAAGGSPGTPAEWGTRAIAYLIDVAPIFVVYVIIAIAGLIADTLGLLVSLVGYLAVFGYSIWNFYIKQGSTGQTIGKEQQGIKLVMDESGQPVGVLMAFVRYLLVGAFILLCCVGWVVNLLAPLWNTDKKTYSDQILKMSVVQA